MKPIEIIAQDLFDKVRSRFGNLQMGDENGEVTAIPTEARFFDFDFAVESATLGRVSISINDIGNLKVFYSQGITEDADPIVQSMWYDFLREMRFFAKRRLLRFDTRDITKGNLDKNDFQYLAKYGSKDNNMNESAMYGSSKTSRRTIEDTDLIIRHSEAIDPTKPGARSRKIKNLFIQNKEGERFKFPFVYLPGARAMQRHVANGGYPHDDAGKNIIKTCEEILKLSDFGRKVKHTSLNDDAHAIAEKAANKLHQLRHHMECMSKQKYYETWRETLQPSDDNLIELDDVAMESLKTTFTVSKFDEALTDVFPILHAIMQEESEVDLEEYVQESTTSEESEHLYNKWQANIIDDLGDGYFLGDDSYDDDDGFTKEGWAVFYQVKPDAFRRVGTVDVSPYPQNRKPGELDAKIQQLKDADMAKQSSRSVDEFSAFESWLDEDITGYGLTDQELAQLQELVSEPLLIGANDEAVQALAGIGIKDPELVNALRAMAEMPNGEDVDARDIIKTFLGADADKLDWGDAQPADVAPAPEEPAAEPAPEEPATAESSCDQREYGQTESTPLKGKVKEVAKIVSGFYNRQDGTWTKGEQGVITHVKRRFAKEDGSGGEQEAALAAKLIHHLNSQHQEKQAFEDIRKLAGLIK